MSKKRSTGSITRQRPSTNSGANTMLNQEKYSTSEVYKQAYQSLMDNELNNQTLLSNAGTASNQTISSPCINNLKPDASRTNSPLRRPLSPSEKGASADEDHEQSPNSNNSGNCRKKTKHINDNHQQQAESLPSDFSGDGPSNNVNININTDITDAKVLTPAHPTASASSSSSISIDKTITRTPSNILTVEAKAFAQSRYPFPPFILRFATPYINEQKLTEELCKFIKANHNLDLELSGYRKSTSKCSINECDLLIFVKNSRSFSTLLNLNNWPQSILGLAYGRPSTPAIPPQLSLIIKNVSLSINFTELSNEIKTSYSNISNVIRMKNKNQAIIKMVKLEFSDYKQRDEILNNGKIFINSLTYDVDEYLAPARVLICSKCMAIGHFRKQCKQENETCRKCGDTTPDMKQHLESCSQIKCKHCNGDHMSNDMKCPTVKQFRAELTKQLLAPTSLTNAHIPQYDLSTCDFPPLNPAQRPTIFKNSSHRYVPTTAPQWSTDSNSSNALMNNKMDVLLNNINQIKTSLDKICTLNDKFEQFMNTKIVSDEILEKKVDDLVKREQESKLGVIQHEIKLTRHDNIFTKVIIPALDETLQFLSHINTNKNGNAHDADFKVIANRLRAQLNNCKQGKDF
ncbi:unnamed protein product [Adineta ricciae]|uniref:Gag-like protein n=1 Tax=Adineta ricciae TaxID=249248 RepID=A0A815E1D5_ADIRI|nr:unnamed protein product [Adineta ricciae]CAF1614739.1 unnamed protein product [Adineta ricciae]